MIKFTLIFLLNNNLQHQKSYNMDIKYFKLGIYVIMVYDHFVDKGELREG